MVTGSQSRVWSGPKFTSTFDGPIKRTVQIMQGFFMMHNTTQTYGVVRKVDEANSVSFLDHTPIFWLYHKDGGVYISLIYLIYIFINRLSKAT